MKGRKIEEMGVSSRGMYMRNIAITADIPELYEIAGLGDENDESIARNNIQIPTSGKG